MDSKFSLPLIEPVVVIWARSTRPVESGDAVDEPTEYQEPSVTCMDVGNVSNVKKLASNPTTLEFVAPQCRFLAHPLPNQWS